MNSTITRSNISLTHFRLGNHRVGTLARIRNPVVSCRILFRSPSCHQLRFRGIVSGVYGSGALKRRRCTSTVSSLDLPLLPFNMNEVLVPTESKTLHLYEARYLALLEESLQRKNNMFVHFVLDPISISDTATEASFTARFGCLVVVESVERLDVGALVSIRGVGRVKISTFSQADPYLSGEVRPMRDHVVHESNEINSKVTQLKESIRNLNSLEIKLKAPKDAPLQTRIYNSLSWAETEPSLECNEAFLPSLAERVSFAAFQLVSGSTQSELYRLQEEKLKAMELKDTMERLQLSMELIKMNISSVAAKLAIQSLDIKT